MSNKFEIERSVMKENSARFTLAYSSPLLQSPCLEKIVMFAEKKTGQQVISQGEVKFKGELDLTALMSLFYKGNSIKIQSCLDVVTWQNYWKQETGFTSSSLSGLHFGHYRSQATDLLLSGIRCSVINLAIRNSTPLLR